jgi:hypothetical protein
LPKDEAIRSMIFQELKSLPRFVTMTTLKEQMNDLWQDVDRKCKDMESMVYAQKGEFERLSVDVKNMNLNPRSRQESVSSEANFREVEARLQPKIDNVRKSLNTEVRSLNEKIDKLEKDTAPQPQRRISSTPTAKAEDIVRVTPLFVAPSHPN